MFLQPNTFEHTHCHCSSYLRIRSTFTGILREKKILLTPSYSVTTINYVSVAKLRNALSGKKTFLLAWSNRKPTEVQKFQLDDVSLRKSGINTDRTIKFLHNSNPEGLLFKIVRGFFDIAICCFAIFLSSLLIKILPIFIDCYLGSLLTKFFKAIRKISYHVNIFKEGTFAEKRSGLFASKVLEG